MSNQEPAQEIVHLTPSESQLISPIMAELERLQQLASIAAGAMVASRELPGQWMIKRDPSGQLVLARMKEN